MPSVEERLAAVEQKLQTLEQADVGAGLRAQAYGLSLVRAEMATKADVAELHAKLDAVLARLSDLLER